MQRNQTLSVLGSVALWLAISSASAMVCLGWVMSAMPNSLAQRISDKTLHLIGNAALSWLCFYFVLFALPLGVAIGILRCTKLHGFSNGAPERFGVGLSNTFARLQQLYGDSGKLIFGRTSDGEALVSIQIPFRTSARERFEVKDSTR